MPGVQRECNDITYGGSFPCSQYHDPRGGRPSALEMNILRYRAYEVSLFLFYVEDLKRFMLDNIYSLIPEPKRVKPVRTIEEMRLAKIISDLTYEARQVGKISAEDAESIRQLANRDPDENKRLKKAFAHAVELGVCTEQSAAEIQKLIGYRNEIAHRMHKITADISRHSIAIDYAAIIKGGYQADALDRLRILRKEVFESKVIKSYLVSMNSFVFESAERFYEGELKRLNPIIRKQANVENNRAEKIFEEVGNARIEFSDALDPRHPRNFYGPIHLGKEDYKFTNKLTSRGVELCYRLFDADLKCIVVSYLMGLTLRSVERRRIGWLKSGGVLRDRVSIDK